MNEKNEVEEKVEEKKEVEIKHEEKEIASPKKLHEESRGIRSELNEVKEQIKILVAPKESKLKKKRFKFPMKVRNQTKRIKKLIERNKIQVMLLKEEGIIQPTIGEKRNGMILVGDYIYNGSAETTWFWDGKTPTAIIAEWDLQPITRATLKETTDSLKSYIYPERIIIRAMELKEALDGKKPVNMKTLILMGIIGIIVAWVFMSGQGG